MYSVTKEKVLFFYADDDPDDHEFLTDAVNSSFLQYEYRSAFNGAELIQLLKNNAGRLPDFLIVDLNMPKVDGFTAITLIKNELQLRNLPIFTLSTTRNVEHIARAQALGVIRYYTKPSRVSELKEILEDMALCALKYQEK